MNRLKVLSLAFIVAVMGITRPDRRLVEILTPKSSLERGSDEVKKHWRQIIKITPVDRDDTGGTGFAIKAPSGRILTVTNAHVCEVAQNGKAAARWDNGRYTNLDVLEVDAKHDLCLLSGLPGGIEGLEMAWNDAQINDPVYVIGHPLLYPNTYSEGLVRDRTDIFIVKKQYVEDEQECSDLDLKYKVYPSVFGDVAVCGEEFDSFGMSAKIMPGNSGSPVFNMKGKVVGVVFAGDNRTGDGSYVPLEHLERILASY